MKYSIETRIPFLSNITYQFSQSLTLEEKTFNKKIIKKPLKDFLEKYLSKKCF